MKVIQQQKSAESVAAIEDARRTKDQANRQAADALSERDQAEERLAQTKADMAAKDLEIGDMKVKMRRIWISVIVGVGLLLVPIFGVFTQSLLIVVSGSLAVLAFILGAHRWIAQRQRQMAPLVVGALMELVGIAASVAQLAPIVAKLFK